MFWEAEFVNEFVNSSMAQTSSSIIDELFEGIEMNIDELTN